MLGPSMVFAGVPVAFGASLIALWRGADRVFAILAIALSSVELIALICLFVVHILWP